MEHGKLRQSGPGQDGPAQSQDELFDGIDISPSRSGPLADLAEFVPNLSADLAEFVPDEFDSLLPLPPKKGDPSPRNSDSPTLTDTDEGATQEIQK